MANDYDKRFAEINSIPSIANELVNCPVLFELLGDIKDKNILELGCGSGYWLKKLSERGAICTGIDISNEQLKIAKERIKNNKVKLIQGDIANKLQLESESFDIVLLIKVILEEGNRQKIDNMIKNAYKFLKKQGRLIILDLHPFAPNVQKSIETPNKYKYFNSGEVVRAMSTRTNGEKMYYNDHHWTIEDFSEFLYKNNFLIRRLIEHKSSANLVKEYPSLENRQSEPMDIFIEAVKN